VQTIPVRRVPLPFGFVAEFRFDPVERRFSAEWEPCVPRIKEARPRRKFFSAYCAARDAYLQEVADTIGGGVMVADLDVTSGEVSGVKVFGPGGDGPCPIRL
jgi:hypothetical protein